MILFNIFYRKGNVMMVKASLDNKLIGARRTLRSLIIDRVVLQHQMRIVDGVRTYFTETHAMVLRNLFDLAISHYPRVRASAQDILCHMTMNYAYSYKKLLDPVIALLDSSKTEDEVPHEAFKGALYVLLGQKDKTILTKHDWSTLLKVEIPFSSRDHHIIRVFMSFREIDKYKMQT